MEFRREKWIILKILAIVLFILMASAFLLDERKITFKVSFSERMYHTGVMIPAKK